MMHHDNDPLPMHHHHPFPSHSLPALQMTQQERHAETQAQRQVRAEPLNDAQEVLASTAQSFIQELDTESSILRDNPKLAQSEFFELVNALGRKEVVVQEAPVSETEEVGEGAKFVERAVGADWAADFTSSNAPFSASAPSFASATLRFQPQSSSAQMPAAAQGGDLRWEEEFARMTMPEVKAGPSRRKSVHFEEQSQSVSDEFDADVDAFDHDTFADFNGQMRQARTPRLGIGAFEAWEELQRDREELDRQVRTELRGMANDERYLFQNGNPYTAGAVDIDAFRQESPTIKVNSIPLKSCRVLLMPNLGPIGIGSSSASRSDRSRCLVRPWTETTRKRT